MKITLCGRPGSGKSVVGKALAKEYNLKHYSTGDFQRKIAMERGYTIEQWSHVTPVEVDHMIDSWVENIGKTEDNFIFDSRLAFHFIQDAIKIYLDVSWEEGARRIFLNQRESEAKAESALELEKRNKVRWETDRERYKKIYNVDIDDPKHYNAYVNTTGKNIEDAIKEIKRIIETLRK